MSTIGDNIKALREMKGLSQSDVGRLVGKTRSAVSQWEHGVSSPSMETASKLADAFGVKLSEITDGHTEFAFVSDFDDVNKTRDTMDMQEVFGKLDEQRRRLVIMLAKMMLKQQREEAEDDGPQE